LKKRGVDIDYVPVSGRSTSELNSKTIAARIEEERSDVRAPLILVGYSKGAADILEALARYPQAAARVAAVISVAGAINGSPLASRYLGLYARLLDNLAFGACPPGDGGVLESFTRYRRLSWLGTNPIPMNIKYYSIGTFTTPSHLARALAYPQRQLSRIAARNDGQLLAQDQLIPGSQLLGYANADHWAIAVRMEDRFPFLAHRAVGKHPFPQDTLFEAILLFVQQDLTESAIS
jgi:pimeloyl-ACP methyl ester carboxylesterase